MKKNIESAIREVFAYFAFFSYAPTVKELHMFLKQELPKSQLKEVLTQLSKKKKVKKVIRGRYTLGEYSISEENIKSKLRNSNSKFQIARRYSSILGIFPFIKLVGISGSVAMLNALENDDVDIFLITKRNRLWTGRFVAVMIAKLMGLHRGFGDKNTKDKVCLNLFFEETELLLPRKKRSEYGAHELLQMKPLVNKGDIYTKLLDVNKWVFDIFPNARLGEQTATYGREKGDNDLLENFLKKIQLRLMNKHKTTELITDYQLWFHPEDFQKKLKKNSLRSAKG